jgi:CubicO group peptidase (beta-lactamase class C family)
LTHTSGIVDNIVISVAPPAREDAALSTYAYNDFASAAYLMAPAGKFFNYSNPNFILLGLLTETVANRDYPSVVTDNVLTPLGMNRTFFRAKEVRADGNYALGASCNDDASCQWPKDAQTIEPEDFDDAWLRPAGGAWSSVLDLAKWGTFLLNGNEQVLGREEWKAMVAPQVGAVEVGQLNDYGFGVSINQGITLGSNEYYGLESRGHTGLVAGYSAALGCFPALDFCMVSLASAEQAFFQQSLVVALKTLTNLPEPEPAPNVAVDIRKYVDYVGTYEDPFTWGTVKVTTKDSQLWVALPDVDAKGIPYDPELVPLYSDSFVMTINGRPITVTFIADGLGPYKYLRSRQAVATRTEPENAVRVTAPVE